MPPLFQMRKAPPDVCDRLMKNCNGAKWVCVVRKRHMLAAVARCSCSTGEGRRKWILWIMDLHTTKTPSLAVFAGLMLIHEGHLQVEIEPSLELGIGGKDGSMVSANLGTTAPASRTIQPQGTLMTNVALTNVAFYGTICQPSFSNCWTDCWRKNRRLPCSLATVPLSLRSETEYRGCYRWGPWSFEEVWHHSLWNLRPAGFSLSRPEGV